jgi:hypothetical protein
MDLDSLSESQDNYELKKLDFPHSLVKRGGLKAQDLLVLLKVM